MTRSDEVRIKFYDDPRVLVVILSKADELIVLEGNMSAHLIATLAATGPRSRPEERSAGRAGDQGDLRRRWLNGSPSRHRQDKASTAASQETTRCHQFHYAKRNTIDSPEAIDAIKGDLGILYTTEPFTLVSSRFSC
ncbi:hypothetical protein SprV_0902687300 [Sparganum proliferum]